MKFADFAILSIGVLLNALAQLGLKAATRASGPMHLGEPNVGQQMLQVLAVPSLWGALLAYALSGVWVIALSRVPVGQAYPLLSMGYIVNIGLASRSTGCCAAGANAV
jgi:hypothetical protein